MGASPQWPVNAHRQEFRDSAPLRAEIQELLSMDGVGRDAIFGWFFGHEHRFAAYDDGATPYNARLIGNGCIPQQVQTEKAADPGCTPVAFFNKRETRPRSNAAVSLQSCGLGARITNQLLRRGQRCLGNGVAGREQRSTGWGEVL